MDSKMTQSRTSSFAVKERFMVVKGGNECDLSQGMNVLYSVGISSLHRAVNSRASARERGQGELSVSSSRHKG